MQVTIVPFLLDHIKPAAELLSARHHQDRVTVPSLAPMYESADATLQVIEDLLAADGTKGVVALQGDDVVGYLLGAPQLRSPIGPFAGVIHPRSAEIDYAGHAVEEDRASLLYGRLYASVAQQWVEAGLVGHYITVPADQEATPDWRNLGFARFITMAVRPTTAPFTYYDRPTVDIEVRRATIDDEEAVQALVTGLFRSFADPPIFVPFLPETAAERSRFVAAWLADPANTCWLAFANDRPVSMQMFEEPSSSHWHQSPMESIPRSVYLFLAYTVPEARGAGLGTTLLAHSMTWARDANYDSCMLHFFSSSRAAEFWLGFGFQPMSFWLRRAIDERTTWAQSRH